MGDLFNGVSQRLNSASQGLTPQNNYQASSPLNVQQLQEQLNQAQGNFNQGQDQQQQLARAILAQSQGQGPNPAQEALKQATNQNIQQNAGFISSQKGINPALAARIAAENAGNINQQAAGQAAVMNAQQQQGAQQQLGGLYGQMANQNLQNISTSGSLANQAGLGAQQINAGTSAQNAAATQKTEGGILNGGAAAIGLADGGSVPGSAGVQNILGMSGPSASDEIAAKMMANAGVQNYAAGTKINSFAPMNSAAPAQAQPLGSNQMAGGADAVNIANQTIMSAAHGGNIPAHMHHIAKIYHPQVLEDKRTAKLKAAGGDVPGRAKVPGDSPKNDVVPTLLSPKEFVLPRSVMQSEDPAEAAKKFVAEHLKKNAKSGSAGDFHSALKNAIGSRKAK